MQGLIIQGIPIRVVKDSWREAPMVYQGERIYTKAGTIVSTEDQSTGLRVADCSIYFLDRTEEATLRAAIAKGVAAIVSGTLPGDDWNALVDIGEATRKKADAFGALHWVAALHIEEASPPTGVIF